MLFLSYLLNLKLSGQSVLITLLPFYILKEILNNTIPPYYTYLIIRVLLSQKCCKRTEIYFSVLLYRYILPCFPILSIAPTWYNTLTPACVNFGEIFASFAKSFVVNDSPNVGGINF